MRRVRLVWLSVGGFVFCLYMIPWVSESTIILLLFIIQVKLQTQDPSKYPTNTKYNSINTSLLSLSPSNPTVFLQGQRLACPF